MAKSLCRCGHRKYKHTMYPINTPRCKGEKWNWIGGIREDIIEGCHCLDYNPMDNLQYLEFICKKRSR